jgi:nuclear-control-of-ATPase protein 2
MIWSSRSSLQSYINDAIGTIQGFWKGWVIEPIRGIVNTVRSGGMEGALISKEGLKSDLDSLERMVLSLCAEKLKFPPEQLEEIAQHTREGDLTPVLKLYENDMKRPIVSAVTGTFVRTVLIQVQKTKVDLDFALTGIDKLIRSQELTFAFVGLAPSLAIIYITTGWLRNVWRGGRGRGKFGGTARRQQALFTMRRIERLLNEKDGSPDASSHLSDTGEGLLFLSLISLRQYAVRYLPPGTRLHEGFLEDLTDLEHPHLSRSAKVRVVDRMWRCWGVALGWSRIGNL